MTNDREQTLRNLKSRIEELRARIERPTDVPPISRVHLSEKTEDAIQSVDTTGSSSRPSEANDLKAKLLGLKKQ